MRAMAASLCLLLAGCATAKPILEAEVIPLFQADGGVLTVTLSRGTPLEGRARALAEKSWQAFCSVSAKQYDCTRATNRQALVVIRQDGGCGAFVNAEVPDPEGSAERVGVSVSLQCIRQEKGEPDLFWVTGYCAYDPKSPPLLCESEYPFGRPGPPSDVALPVDQLN